MGSSPFESDRQVDHRMLTSDRPEPIARRGTYFSVDSTAPDSLMRLR